MSFAACQEWLIDFAEPILVLEMRRFRRSGLTAVAVAGALMLTLPAVFVASHDQGFAQLVLMFLAVGYPFAILTLIPSHGGRTISREREAGTWDLLMLTPAKSSQIADQKMLGAAVPMLLLIAAGFPVDLIAAVIGRVSVLQVAAIVLMLALAALGVSYWSLEASCDCGRAATWIAYLPVASYLCSYLSCGGFLVAIVLLFIPQVRGQAGRMLLAAMCLQVVLGAVAIAIMASSGMLAQVFAIAVPVPANVIAVAALLLQILALIGMRHLVIWSIETWRRT